MDDQVTENFFKMIEQEIAKASAVQSKYLSIDEAIQFLWRTNKAKYSQDDLKELAFCGVLTPYFYYQGILIRVDRLGENLMDESRGLATFEGYVTPFNHSTVQAMRYASSEVKISFRNVLIAKDFITLEVYADSLDGVYGAPLKHSFSESYEDVSFYTIPDDADRKNLHNHPICHLPKEWQFSSCIEDVVFHQDDLVRIQKNDQERFDTEQLIESQKDNQIAELQKENESLKHLVSSLRQSQASMICCDPEHKYYAPELHDVIKLWSYLYLEGGLKAGYNHSHEVKRWIKTYFEESANDLEGRYLSVTTPLIYKPKNFKYKKRITPE